ncbi:myrosinase 1-like [Sipha flava]|uniref:Myrosinase 1-like n=1 Tax=Sipha flava TaxID=143950 RepID=A0A8B8FGG4_9HEMI|nr:myrosinase 1-like [Sipha flava]
MTTKDNAPCFASTGQFPESFLFGASTGAYQVEGAWNEGKPPTIWDDYFHKNQAKLKFRYFLNMPEHVFENLKQKDIEPRLVDMYKGMAIYEVPSSAVEDEAQFNFNGDIAADSYHKTDVDVQLLKELGVKVYRFTIAQTRIIPEVYDHLPGHAGIKYYNSLIDKLLENGITPVVNLHHYDMGSNYIILGGLTNHTLYTFFENYARLCFESFGDRVKHWVVSSDIWFSAEGYSSEHIPPGYKENSFSGYSDYKTIHNCIVSMAKIYKMYNTDFKEKQKGQLGYCVDTMWFYPQDPNNPEHQKCAERARKLTFGALMDVYITGQYSNEMLESVKATNEREGIRVDRIKQFTAQEQELIKGSFDFVMVNYFSSVKVRPMTSEERDTEPNRKRRDRGYYIDVDSITPTDVYEGFLNCLRWTKENMNNPRIIIGENGFPEEQDIDDSEKKIAYHQGILTKLLEALDENINVFGYCVWSFIDGLEFCFGYWKKFGIYAVDFNDESRPRSKKRSFPFFNQLFTTKKLPMDISIN